MSERRRRRVRAEIILTAVMATCGNLRTLAAEAPGASETRAFGGYPNPAPTTKIDFFRGGSQPDGSYEQILHSRNCGSCHGDADRTIPINKAWEGSMHAQSARDLLWFACLTVAEQDAPFVGDMCIRCHVPRAWIMGRSEPTDGSKINFSDRNSVNCHFCHRMVNPFYDPQVDPIVDRQIVENIKELPVTNGSASFVLDPFDRRRGKRGVTTPHGQIESPFHDDSVLCETCHDVSNPVLIRQPDDTYVAGEFDEPHPTGQKYEMFPGERTFSEWSVSAYAEGGVDAEGRFGGNKQVVSSCQDCHMPDVTGKSAEMDAPVRDDLADHAMVGGATWMPRVVANLYPDEVDKEALEAGMAAAESMLQRSATMELTQTGDEINVRVTNETGHKLPSGQPEGREMWVNVRYFDEHGRLIGERGAYDEGTARPARDTQHYEIVLGIDDAVAAATGLPVGPTHHIAFCNVIYKDTRIPPRGCTNEELRQVQSPVVGTHYADGQHWDDTPYVLPIGAVRVEAAVFYKTASTEFIKFLRDANYTNDAGQRLYEQWELTGKSPPVEIVAASLTLEPFASGDFDNDGDVDGSDFGRFSECVGDTGGPPSKACEPGDLDADDDIDLIDFARFQRRFGS